MDSFWHVKGPQKNVCGTEHLKKLLRHSSIQSQWILFGFFPLILFLAPLIYKAPKNVMNWCLRSLLKFLNPTKSVTADSLLLPYIILMFKLWRFSPASGTSSPSQNPPVPHSLLQPHITSTYFSVSSLFFFMCNSVASWKLLKFYTLSSWHGVCANLVASFRGFQWAIVILLHSFSPSVHMHAVSQMIFLIISLRAAQYTL